MQQFKGMSEQEAEARVAMLRRRAKALRSERCDDLAEAKEYLAVMAKQNMSEDTGEDSIARAARHLPAEGDNTRPRVTGGVTVQSLPLGQPTAVVVALPQRPDVELSWPADPSDDDDFRVVPHGAELLIFRREPADQAWCPARRAALWAGADHPREAGALR